MLKASGNAEKHQNSRRQRKTKSQKMRIKLAGDVYRCCYHHALSTQSEEVMGLLMGEKKMEENETVIEISAIRIVPRMDKRSDRVEISDDQMIMTTQMAEELAQKLNKPNLCVIGWYHSHPNITVWPSHVDLRTQFNYQRLSKDFIGLIFCVFNIDKAEKMTHRYELVAFQAQEDENKNGLKQVLIPLEVTSTGKMNSHVAEEMVRLSDILCQENLEAAKKVTRRDTLTQLKLDFGN